jgi:2,4-dienoyl-CoA reductase-like NADH-dependent reductase (Old Yellow Enzyme family)
MVLRLDTPLTLPCGVVLPNRIAKTALGEGLADFSNRATPGHATLYQRWARGGAGLLVTGAVQVDRRYLDRPNDVVLEGPQSFAASTALTALAMAAKSSGGAVFMQLSHAGLQSAPAWCSEPVGPGAPLPANGRALSGAEIEDIVRRFVLATGIALECGFDGVQILAGQGRLIGSFLSAIQNTRTDGWGGDLSQRARLLLDIARGVRAAYGAQPALSVKLSTGGEAGDLEPGEVLMLADWLTREGVDIIEISQGLYGRVSRQVDPTPWIGAQTETSSAAKAIRAGRRSCVMLSGGLRSRRAVDELLTEGVLDVAGFARPFCADPDFAHEFLDQPSFETPDMVSKFAPEAGAISSMVNKLERVAGLQSLAADAWCALAMQDIADGLEAPRRRSAQSALRDFARKERAFIKGLAA